MSQATAAPVAPRRGWPIATSSPAVQPVIKRGWGKPVAADQEITLPKLQLTAEDAPVPAPKEIRHTRGFNRVQRGDIERHSPPPKKVPRDRAKLVPARSVNPIHALSAVHTVPGSIEEVRIKLANQEQHRKQWRNFILYWDGSSFQEFHDMLFEFAWDCRTVEISTPLSFVPVHPLEMTAAEFQYFERQCDQIWEKFQEINVSHWRPVPMPPHFRNYWFTFTGLRQILRKLITPDQLTPPEKRRLLRNFGAYRIIFRW